MLCIGADPGSPAFGVPGAICLAEWHGEDWRLISAEALCSLNAARFRLPLVSSVRRLAARVADGILIVDAAGVARGVAGAELLAGLAEAAAVDTVVAMTRHGEEPAYRAELAALAVRVCLARAAPGARRPGKGALARRRTRLWNAYLAGAEIRSVAIHALELLGTPPPVDVPAAWPGRQLGLLDADLGTLALGEALRLEAGRLWLKAPPGGPRGGGEARCLLVRDARRDPAGRLVTARREHAATVRYAAPPDIVPASRSSAAGDGNGPRPVARVGAALATLVNGVFGDPLLHLRLRHEKRSLLFDLGEAGRLPARIAHQVTDVFISHAHFDHIAGFLWLLRSRIADLPPCRVFGPPGISENIDGLVRGICWDRVGERGPRFEVAELHGEKLHRFAVQAGRAGRERLDARPAPNGLLLCEPGFGVRAATLDHGTPVLAFAFAPGRKLKVRKDRLTEMGLSAGAWLSELKQRLLAGDHEAVIELPDGRNERARTLGDALILESPGEKLAYATDLADSPANRERLVALAEGAHTFFCEAVFVEADAVQAARTGHLTARGCGEIADAAGVTRLVPFHFSRRYEDDPDRIYEEVARACSRTMIPNAVDLAAS